MHLIGIEPTHAAPEATALSTELQMHLRQYTIIFNFWQGVRQTFFNNLCRICAVPKDGLH